MSRAGGPGDTKVRDHADALTAFIAIHGTLLIEERGLYLIYDIVAFNCLLRID